MSSNADDAPPMRNHDGSEMLDEHARGIHRSQFLSTHPLRSDVKEKMGEGGKPLTYITGDGVIRSMNMAFGHEGWSTSITRERQVDCVFNKGKFLISYMASVKVTLLKSGASHEDVGCGEGSHESKLKALDTAIKSAVTDAMKRAARHFGERLGNALYIYGNGMNRAPKDNKTALRDLERQEASDFGNQKALHELRARNMQEAAAAAAATTTENQQPTSVTTAPSNRNDQQQQQVAGANPPPPATLQRQTTPPGGAPVTQGNKQTPPAQQLGHGFTRASELAVMVTPGQQAATATGATTTSPQQQASPNALNTQPSPATARYGHPSTQPPARHSPPFSNANQQAHPMKRQKVVHNPYQN